MSMNKEPSRQLQKSGMKILYELSSVDQNIKKNNHIINRGRVLIGSSESCDIVLRHSDIAAIHAVLEITGTVFRIFDMHSLNGTYHNNKKIIVENFIEGDLLKFGSHSFVFRKYAKEESLPPVLDMLGPEHIRETEAKRYKHPPAIPEDVSKIKIDIKSMGITSEIPQVEYPLAKDPRADYIEYIFEETDTLYPIFKYSVDRSAVEVIILYKNKIYSVDYLPTAKGVYNLVGSKPSKNEIEYAYLVKNEKVQFLDVVDKDVYVNLMEGYDYLLLSDKNDSSKKIKSGQTHALRGDDIIRFSKNDIQIFVRLDSPPPTVAPAKILTGDKDLLRYTLLMLFLFMVFTVSINLMEINREVEKEKVPERIATILYNQKLYVAKTKAIAKTADAPKVIQEARPDLPNENKQEKKAEVRPADKPKEAEVVKVAGQKSEKEVKQIKKAEPNKGAKDVHTDLVQPNNSAKTKNVGVMKQATTSEIKAPSLGHVDVYKSADFGSTLSSMLSKGGASKQMDAVNAVSGGTTSSALVLEAGAESATLKRANVGQQIGSLSGVVQGKIDTSKGVEGLANKKGIYVVGVPSNTVIVGSMDPDVIRRILMENFQYFRNCYQRTLSSSNQAFDGMLPLNFVIGASGHVIGAGIGKNAESSALPGEVKSCVIDVLKGIKFPDPLGGGTVEVNQPMNFYRK